MSLYINIFNCFYSDGPLVPPVWNENTKKELTYYLINSAYLHSLYAYRYVLCELLNFINVVSTYVYNFSVYFANL